MKLLRPVLLVTCALVPRLALAQPAAVPPAAAASAASPTEVFRRMSSDTWITRVITLADIGITKPLVLGYPETVREIALPVPPGVPMANGSVQMDAHFVRAGGGPGTHHPSD